MLQYRSQSFPFSSGAVLIRAPRIQDNVKSPKHPQTVFPDHLQEQVVVTLRSFFLSGTVIVDVIFVLPRCFYQLLFFGSRYMQPQVAHCMKPVYAKRDAGARPACASITALIEFANVTIGVFALI